MTQSHIPHRQAAELARSFNGDLVALALSLLPQAAGFAVVPVSQFKVGAVAIDAEGNFYLGANQECAAAAIGQTVHAEQSAVSHAWMRGAARITDIVVNYTPCGHCRQFLNELPDAGSLKIHLPHSRNNTLADFLPDSFSPKDLDISERLLVPVRHNIRQPENLDALQQAAFQAASTCHAPYSHAYAGAALLAADGTVYAGRYAENAAYNPSLPPLQVALNLLRLDGRSEAEVRRAVLACTRHGGHEAHARALWDALGGCPLETVLL